MRTLEAHKTNPANDLLTIQVRDEPGAGGACHFYRITGFNTNTNTSAEEFVGNGTLVCDADVVDILFQNGPIPSSGVNGVTHESLLAILIDRLECFQAGRYACDENRDALHHCRQALAVLHRRTQARMARNVEAPMLSEAVGKIKFGSNQPARALAEALHKHPHGVAAVPDKQDRIIKLLENIVEELKLLRREGAGKRKL